MTTELLSWLIAPFCGRWGQITHWVSQVEGRANLQLIIMPYGVTHNVSFLLNWNLKRQRHTAHYAWRLAPYNCHSSITGALSRRFSGFVKSIRCGILKEYSRGFSSRDRKDIAERGDMSPMLGERSQACPGMVQPVWAMPCSKIPYCYSWLAY